MLDILYDQEHLESSALKLVYAIRPDWETSPGDVEITPLLGGVPNTLLKITKDVSGIAPREKDSLAIILRANGQEPKVLVDRDLEAKTHATLAEQNLASPLYARFRNGLLYAYLPGRACQLQDLAREEIWSGVATRLGEWHAKMPHASQGGGHVGSSVSASGSVPNIWSAMQRWVSSLPSHTAEEAQRREALQKELTWCYSRLEDSNDPAEQSVVWADIALGLEYVFGHCDLLCGNILIAQDDVSAHSEMSTQVSPGQIRFIDYEFSMHCPAAFDIANHFSEWGGFECNYDLIPGQILRRKFIDRYLSSYMHHANMSTTDFPSIASRLAAKVDSFRGVPGLWWAIHGFVSVLESKVDFDWIPYANKRMAEYWDWKAAAEGSRFSKEEEMTWREKMWARE